MFSTSINEDEGDERQPLLQCQVSKISINTIRTASPEELTNGAADSAAVVRVLSESSRQRPCHCLTSYVPIEPLLFVYAFARAVLIGLNTFYYFDVASQMYGDPSMSSLHPCGNNHSGSSPSDKERAENVQAETLQLGMLTGLSGFFTAVIPTIFLGPATDRVGRRLGLVLPLLGLIARSIVFLFVVGTNASVYFLIVGVVLEGLSGALGAFLMTSFSAAADVTTPGRQRSLRICIIDAVQVFGAAVAFFVIGQWRKVSYTQPIMMATALSVAGLIYALWGWPETRHSSISTSTEKSPPPETADPQRDTETYDHGQGIRDSEILVPEDTTDGVSIRQGQEGRPRQGQQGRPRQGHNALTTNQGQNERVNAHAETDDCVLRDRSNINGDILSSDRGNLLEDEAELRREPYGSFPPANNRMSFRTRSIQRQASCTSYVSITEGSCAPIEDGETMVETSDFPVPEDNTSSPDSCCTLALRNFRKSWVVYFRKDVTSQPHRRHTLGLCIVCFTLAGLVNAAKPAVESVFRMGELCWDAVQESEFYASWLVLHWLFILVVLQVRQHRLHVPDLYMALAGCFSALCEPLVFSCATLPGISRFAANVFVFASAGSGMLTRVLMPILRAISSAVVDPDEQGALFTSYACVQLAGPALFDMAAIAIYNATVHVWQGIIFLVLTVLLLIAFILLIILFVIQRRKKGETSNTDTKSLRQNSACQE